MLCYSFGRDFRPSGTNQTRSLAKEATDIGKDRHWAKNNNNNHYPIPVGSHIH